METNFWRVSAGTNGKYWEEFLHEEKIKIGWQKLPDASHILTVEECKKFFESYDEHTKTVKYFFSFLKEMKHGDIVFISKGHYDILGIGEIVSDYDFDNDPISDYKHFRKIRWLSTITISNILNRFQETLKQIHTDELAKILSNDQIRYILGSHKSIVTKIDFFTDFPLEAYEGYQREQFVKHVIRERDKKLIKDYKEKNNSIQICPACNFNPQLIYDLKAIDLFEVHHLVPIGSRNEQTNYQTQEKDLTLLCPNCHRFIHKLILDEPHKLISLDMLKSQIQK